MVSRTRILNSQSPRHEADPEASPPQRKPEYAYIGLTPSSIRRRIEFKYDHLGRRTEKLVRSGWNGSVYATVMSQRRFIYNGWNVIAEYSVSGAALTLARTFTWGVDIAHSLAEAGGVGALLQIADHGLNQAFFPAYDGNGNIAALFNGSSASGGTCVAAYEYSPYGEFLRCEGTYAKENPFRFSTKFTEDETGLVYYGRRYYSPSQGRFLGRDPKGEPGGLNLYGFTSNNPMNRWDYLGMSSPIVMEKFVVREKRLEEILVPVEGTEGFESVWIEVDDDDDYNGDPPEDPNNEQLRKECEGLAGIIGHFQGEAGKALDRFNNQLAYSQRVGASFKSDNMAFLKDGVGFIGDLGGDLAFDYGAGKLLPGGIGDIAGSLNDSVGASSDGDAWSTLGHLTLATYLTTNYLRPTIYRSPNFGRIAKYGGGTLLVGTIAIKAYEHFGATVYNEWQQAGIMEQNNQVTSELMGAYLQQNTLVNKFQEQYKAKGCDKL